MLGSLLSYFFRNNISSTYSMPETWGTSGIDYGSIMQARRKLHRGKMYRRYRGQRLSGKKYARVHR